MTAYCSDCAGIEGVKPRTLGDKTVNGITSFPPCIGTILRVGYTNWRPKGLIRVKCPCIDLIPATHCASQ